MAYYAVEISEILTEQDKNAVSSLSSRYDT